MYLYNNTMYAGINNETEFTTWEANGKPSTGYTFIRILDDYDMGSIIALGMDYSEVHNKLATAPRVDKPEYYKEVKVEEPTNETRTR